ncbi:MAG: CHAT domain-containing protein, partial [Sphaerospermopsis kisseleviana]
GSGNIVINNPVEFKDPTTIKTPNGNIEINNQITGISNASITLDATTTNLNANITTNNQNISIPKNVILGDDINLNTGASGDILLGGTVNGNHNLTLNAGTGNLTFGNAVNVNSLTTTAANTDIANNITTTGTQEFTGAVNLTGNNPKTFNSTNNDILFSSTINGLTTDFTLNAGTGNLTFGNAVNVNSLTTTAANTNIANNITTTGTQEFTGAVNLTGNNHKTFNSTNNDILFSSTINGLTTDFTLNAGAGNLTFGNAVNVNSLTTTAANTNIANNITTAGNQTYNGDVNLTGNNSNQELKSNSGNIEFNGNVAAGNNNVTLTADDIKLPESPTTTTGTGNLTIQSATATRNITLGNEIAGTLNLTITSAEIAGLADGFSSITIGSNDGSGNIAINNPVSFKDPTTIKTPNGTGSISATATITGLNNASINLLANQNISTSNITTQGQNINVTSTIGGISTNDITGNLINLAASQNITTANINGENINLNSSSGGISINNITGGLTNLTANQNINTGKIDTTNDKVNLKSNIGAVTTQNITTQGEDVNIQALVDTSSSSGSGSNPTVDSNTGVVTTQNITTQGGNINIQAKNRIKTGFLDTSSSTGNGGNVMLDPDNDIEVFAINTQALGSGLGGNVDITTKRFFRATGSFDARNGVRSSISTIGGDGNGSVTIRHGGDGNTLFIIGNSSELGTAAAITGGVINNIRPVRSFEGNVTQSNIQIITNSNSSITIEPVPDIPGLLSVSSNPAVTVDTDVATLEERYTAEIESYSGRSFIRKSQADIQAELKQIEAQTGIKSAVVYVGFAPSDDTSQDKDVLYLTIFTSEGKTIRKQVSYATRAKIKEVANELYSEVSNVQNVNSTNYLKSAQQLYKWLIAPYEAELQKQGVNNLSFVLDAGLRFIPIAALHDGQQFLIEKYSLGIIPSASATKMSYSNIKNAQVLAMGASEFAEDQNQNKLEAVPVELDNIANLWNGKSFLNQSFTLENLKTQRQKNPLTNKPFEMIHLATHAEFAPGDASSSYIQLYNSKLGFDQVSELGWDEPPVELLVLSACKSAFGDNNSELGFAGLAVKTGVKSALASLWWVEDNGTMVLMTEFYRQLKISPIKSEALRQTQLAMIQSKIKVEENQLISLRGSINIPRKIAEKLQNANLSHPYYWSAFTMIGSQW